MMKVANTPQIVTGANNFAPVVVPKTNTKPTPVAPRPVTPAPVAPASPVAPPATTPTTTPAGSISPPPVTPGNTPGGSILPGPPAGVTTPGNPDISIVSPYTQGSLNTLGQANDQLSPTGAIPFNQSPGIQAGYARVTGQDVEDDPAIAAAMKNFQSQVQPGIQNSAALAGLGNSNAMVNAIGQAEGSMLAPMYESAFGREQQRLAQGNQSVENELQRRERSSVRGAEANQSSADRLMALSQMLNGRQSSNADQAMQAGGVLRGYDQAGNEAGYNDMLRQQALSESALYQPFGGMLPSAFGSLSSTTGK